MAETTGCRQGNHAIGRSVLIVAALTLGIVIGCRKAESIQSPTQSQPQKATATQPAKQQKPRPKPQPPKFTDASEVIESGPAAVSVERAAVGVAPVTGLLGSTDFYGKNMQVWLKMESLSEKKRKFDYRGVALAELRDSEGNNYRPLKLGFTEHVEGTVSEETIYPGKSIKMCLLFERPVDGIDHLKLLVELNGDVQGPFRFRIPADMIEGYGE